MLRGLVVAALLGLTVCAAAQEPLRFEVDPAWPKRLPNDWIMGQAAGVAVEHVCHDGMVHNFHAMGAILPQAQLVLSQIGEQVRRAVEK